MGRCSTSLAKIVGDHMDNDIRRCGGLIGSKRRQKSRSRGFFHGFCPFFQREAAHLLPRVLHGVGQLIWPLKGDVLVARGCPGAELRPGTS